MGSTSDFVRLNARDCYRAGVKSGKNLAHLSRFSHSPPRYLETSGLQRVRDGAVSPILPVCGYNATFEVDERNNTRTFHSRSDCFRANTLTYSFPINAVYRAVRTLVSFLRGKWLGEPLRRIAKKYYVINKNTE